MANEKAVSAASKQAIKQQSAIERRLSHNIEAITNDICDRLPAGVTPKKRREVEAALADAYLPRMAARARVGPITDRWHSRMVTAMTEGLDRQFNACIFPSAFRKASREERFLMMMSKGDRAAYERQKTADPKANEELALKFVVDRIGKSNLKTRINL
jgi:hypothetical protein